MPARSRDDKLAQAMGEAQLQAKESRPLHPVEQPALQAPPAPEPPTQEDSPLSRLPIPGGERISQYGKTIRDPGQTEQIVQISVRIPRSLREVVRLWCVDTGMSLQEFMTLAAENLCYELQRRAEE